MAETVYFLIGWLLVGTCLLKLWLSKSYFEPKICVFNTRCVWFWYVLKPSLLLYIGYKRVFHRVSPYELTKIGLLIRKLIYNVHRENQSHSSVIWSGTLPLQTFSFCYQFRWSMIPFLVKNVVSIHLNPPKCKIYSHIVLDVIFSRGGLYISFLFWGV